VLSPVIEKGVFIGFVRLADDLLVDLNHPPATQGAGRDHLTGHIALLMLTARLAPTKFHLAIIDRIRRMGDATFYSNDHWPGLYSARIPTPHPDYEVPAMERGSDPG
jgi:hypothetical protein